MENKVIGLKFGQMTVASLMDKGNYKCICSCGKTRIYSKGHVVKAAKEGWNSTCGKCYTFEDWCNDNDHQDYLDLWDYELNDKKPSEIGYNVTKKYYFKCKRGIHKSEPKSIGVYTKNKEAKCIIRCIECETFGQYLIDIFGDNGIEEYWGSNNTMSAFKIKSGDADKGIYMKCTKKEHGEYKTKCWNFCSGQRCPVCVGKKVMKGINDVATTHPHLVKFFYNINDAYTHTAYSIKRIKVVCNKCGRQKHTTISNISVNGFRCSVCSGNKSISERMMVNILKQFDNDFICEYSPDWAKGKRYDFYIPSKNLIIEMDGHFHYNDNLMSGCTVDESKEIDKWKDKQAELNGIVVIRIDCNYTVSFSKTKNGIFEYIKNSILKSALVEYIEFDKIDFNLVKANCFNDTLVYDACNLYTNSNYDSEYIANELKISMNTLSKYIKSGNEIFDWCKKYDKSYFKFKKVIRKSKNNQVKKTNLINKNNQVLVVIYEDNHIIFESKSVASALLKISSSGIYRALKSQRKFRGLEFQWVSKIDVNDSDVIKNRGDMEDRVYYEIQEIINSNHPCNDSIKIDVFMDGVRCGTFNSVYELCKLSKELFGIKFIESTVINNLDKTDGVKKYNGYYFKRSER